MGSLIQDCRAFFSVDGVRASRPEVEIAPISMSIIKVPLSNEIVAAYLIAALVRM